MKYKIPFFGVGLALLFYCTGCGSRADQKKNTEILSLKNAFKNDFYTGVAINKEQINKSDSTVWALIAKEFNSITPENNLKWMNIHPEPDSFAFDIPDRYVALDEKNEIYVVGHTLVWHSQIADYMGQITDSVEMAEQLKNHINTIVNRYKGKIDAWDVVNEALNEDGSLRESIFLKVLGKDYLGIAFDLASKADPDAKLLYNDYNLCKPEKRNGVIRLVEDLQQKGLKIDGVGMQGHWNLQEPSLEDIENSIVAYADLGLKVSITELDITVLPNPWDLEGAEIDQNFEGNAFMNPYSEELPDSVQVELAKRYESIFKLFVKHKEKIERVTFWGLNDGVSWLNNWPIKGRTNYPLLFDRNHLPKKAYHSLIELKN